MLPVIDKRVRYVGASFARSLNVKSLSEIGDSAIVFQGKNFQNLAVLVSWDTYMEMQSIVIESAAREDAGRAKSPEIHKADCQWKSDNTCGCFDKEEPHEDEDIVVDGQEITDTLAKASDFLKALKAAREGGRAFDENK